ncbi:MAG: holo-ACP synthase [Firmicutes bacterium]|nr:holo-ACP synthase [Bacillota bacterium]
MIIGVGIDLVSVKRIEALAGRYGKRFLERVYSPGELAEAPAGPRRRAEHLAARFAVKEAAFKALGTGRGAGIRWTDVSIGKDPAGGPSLILEGSFRMLARGRGAGGGLVSLSHEAGWAVACVVLVGGEMRE